MSISYTQVYEPKDAPVYMRLPNNLKLHTESTLVVLSLNILAQSLI